MVLASAVPSQYGVTGNLREQCLVWITKNNFDARFRTNMIKRPHADHFQNGLGLDQHLTLVP